METPWPVSGMRIVMVGAARTGRATARFLASRGARVILTDLAPEPSLPGVREELEPLGVELAFGPHSQSHFQGAEGIVLSPGVPPSVEMIQRARDRGVPVVAELELASWFLEAPIVAITGTNGKTTTATLVGSALSRWNPRVFVGGNIGNPLITAVGLDPPPELAVVEVSSFQLEGTDRFRPRIAALLNLTQDHLDRHPTARAYREAKGRIFRRQGKGDVAVVNLDDSGVLRALPSCPPMEVWGFTLRQEARAEARCNGDEILLTVRGKAERLPLNNPALAGPHGVQNVMAACLCALAAGCPLDEVEAASAAFSGLKHRMEWVGERGGIRFINDSKATNVGAVIPALLGCPAPVVLIAGGKDKGIDFTPLRGPIGGKARAVVLLGEAAPRLAQALSGAAPLHFAQTMQEAVAKAMSLARPGDIVLLSPACSSFDQYRDYEERGEDFKRAVRLLVLSR